MELGGKICLQQTLLFRSCPGLAVLLGLPEHGGIAIVSLTGQHQEWEDAKKCLAWGPEQSFSRA